MVVRVTASFAQDGVFFANEKLKCQFRFTNPVSREPKGLDHSEQFPTTAIRRQMLRKDSCLSETSSTMSNNTNYDEGYSVPSSRSSSESFSRASAIGFQPYRPGSVSSVTRTDSTEIGTNNGVKSPLSGLAPDSAKILGKTNGVNNHQSSQSVPHARSSVDLKAPIPNRHYRPSSVSSWFSSFSSPAPVSEVKKPQGLTVKIPATKEKLLWGFVQLVGHFVIDDSLIKSTAFQPLKTKKMYRAANGVGYGGSLGGGTMGQNSGSHQLNSSTLADLRKQAESKMFPVYSTPPSVMFCDVSLEPGDSIVYDYEILLPSNLPPSHRGKSTKFIYYLIMGTQQGEITLEPNVIQLPFRLFSRTSDSGSASIYDLLDPVLIHADTAIIKNPHETMIRKPSSIKTYPAHDDFVKKAMASLDFNLDNQDDDKEDSINGSSNLNKDSVSLNNIYSITRRVKPVSYTISKDDTIIGKLALRRCHYRIGETIQVVIQFMPSPVKCYQVSVTLESFEEVEESYAGQTPGRTDQLTRQILAQQQSLSTNADRLTLELSIPSTCTPEFVTSVVKLGYRLRLEFLIGSRSNLNVVTTPLDKLRVLNKVQLPSSADPEKLVCVVPINVLATSSSQSKIYRSTHSFELDKTFLQ